MEILIAFGMWFAGTITGALFGVWWVRKEVMQARNARDDAISYLKISRDLMDRVQQEKGWKV